jgi:outer membrane protein OmpA-like peptidoglycan-associated protein
MRILVTGFVVFVIWCFVSAWLYNDILLPSMKKPVTTQAIPQTTTREADSLAMIKASMPKPFMIHFGFNDAKFKPDPQLDNSISEFKSWLEKYPGSMLLVTGHTDLVGTADYNNQLGLKRAQVVEKYLEDKGINAARMLADSKGAAEPCAGYITDEERAKNRRTEISVKMN